MRVCMFAAGYICVTFVWPHWRMRKEPNTSTRAVNKAYRYPEARCPARRMLVNARQ